MKKKVVIEISLVPESSDKKSAEIEKEIREELQSDFPRIPWVSNVESIKVVEL
jgi:translation elongation factor EF-1beta